MFYGLYFIMNFAEHRLIKNLLINMLTYKSSDSKYNYENNRDYKYDSECTFNAEVPMSDNATDILRSAFRLIASFMIF